MGEVIGPIDWLTWSTLKDISSSLRFYREEPGGFHKYRKAIKTERQLFSYCLDPYINE